jgi:iron complex transport system substrate-binding protein
MRIASLLASATEIVCALGLDEALVAISHECDYPEHVLDRPRVSRPRFDPAGLSSGAVDSAVREALAEHGSVYVLDEAVLREAGPDLILTQDVCDVCAVPTSLAHQAARVLGGEARVLSLDAHTVEGIFGTIVAVGEAAGVPDRAAALVRALRERLGAVARRVANRQRPRVLVLEWLDPVFVPGHWGPEMVALAGGENLVGDAGRRSRHTSWDDVAHLDPDVLMVLPCGYGVAQARAEADLHRDQLLAIAPAAARTGRIWVGDGSAYFNRSGPRVVDGVELMAAAFHPESVRDVELDGRLDRWRP